MTRALFSLIACLALATAAGAGTRSATPFSGTWWVVDRGGGGLEEATFSDRLDFAQSSAPVCGRGAVHGWVSGSVNGNTWTGSGEGFVVCDNIKLGVVPVPSVEFTANPDGTLSSSLTPSSERWKHAVPQPLRGLRPTATTMTEFDDASAITLLSADGTRVAFAGLDPILWDPATGFRSGSLDDDCWGGFGQLAGAGLRVESLCLGPQAHINTLRSLDLGWALHHSRPGGRNQWSGLSIAAQDCATTCLANLAGNGKLLVYNSYHTRGAKTDPRHWWIWRIVGSHRVLVQTSALPLGVVAVDRGRIFVRQFHRLLVLDPSGRLVASYPSPGTGPVAVDGDDLVAGTPVGVTVLDLGTGSITHRWTLPAHAILRDTTARTFVYTVGGTIHLHRLTTGADEALRLRDVNGPVNAQLTDAGLFYSWNLGAEQGFLAFVPTGRLPARFR